MSITVSAHSVRSLSASAKSYNGRSWVDVIVHQDGTKTLAFIAHFDGEGKEVEALAQAYADAINGVEAPAIPVPDFSSEAA